MDIAGVDGRALVRLLAETAAVPGGFLVKKTYLLDGLCELVGADEWRWARVLPDPRPQLLAGFRRTFSLTALPVSSESAATDDWALRSSSDSTGMIFSRRLLAPDQWGIIALCRQVGRPPYSTRERQLANLVLEEVPWLHAAEWPSRPSAPEADLSPRLRVVLEQLLLSRSRKQIASELGLSLHTVSGYVRDIYRRFQVRSHRELLRQSQATSGRILAWVSGLILSHWILK